MLTSKVGIDVKVLILYLILLSTAVEAKAIPSLKVGDILLQPLNCWSCSLIEAEDETTYSHMGLVIDTSPGIKIAESFGTVKYSSFDEFNAKTEKNQKLLLLRFKNKQIVESLNLNQPHIMEAFMSGYAGKKYDEDFLWNNIDETGNEKLYCSEFITKILHEFLKIHLPMKQMHFLKNREHWDKYFKGNVPDGKWGNSPGDFEKSSLFQKVQEL